MVVLLVMTDGRKDCIAQAIPSALANLTGPITCRVIHDDSGDPHYREWLRCQFPDWSLVTTPERRGFGAAVASARQYLTDHTDEPFVLAVEDDFVFDRPVDVCSMAHVLVLRPWLAQMVLLRQPWNESERAAGGIVEQHPGDYKDCSFGVHDWLEHRRFWSTNPSLFRRQLLDVEWPEGGASEGRFSHQLIEQGFDGVAPEAVRFGFWGKRGDGPWVTHIGHERRGHSY